LCGTTATVVEHNPNPVHRFRRSTSVPDNAAVIDELQTATIANLLDPGDTTLLDDPTPY
jgi:hypothetical protein